MWIREEFGRWFTGKRKSGEGKFPCAASRLRSGSLRSPPLRREAAHPPQSVTHAVITKCYLCDDQIPRLALPIKTRVGLSGGKQVNQGCARAFLA
jgi:hypothetical protein